MGIQKLSISGFKSIENVELTDLPNYCVFAGANGAGKSNFFDALRFVSMIVDEDVKKAIQHFGGYERIRNIRKNDQNSTEPSFRFVLDCSTPDFPDRSEMNIFDLGKTPVLGEKYEYNNDSDFRERDQVCLTVGPKLLRAVPPNQSIFHGRPPEKISNFRIFRIDPFRAKEPDEAGLYFDESLDEYGRNLATVLEKMQENKDNFATIMEWMSLIVPGLEQIETYRNPLDGKSSMVFREAGTDYRFPPYLISDGTVYVLCLFAAVLTRIKQPGITMIEEPERGIHPKAIEQLSEFFREQANEQHQIFISTHNESYVRTAKPEELFFVDKKEGATRFRRASEITDCLENMPLDKAWLQNMFSGGLPW